MDSELLKMKFILAFLLLAYFGYCQNKISKSNSLLETIVNPSRINCDKLEIDSIELPTLLWKAKFGDSSVTYSIQPLIKDDRVIISKSNLIPPFELLCFSKTNGEVLWSWNDYFNQHSHLSSEPYYIHNNLMYVCTYGSIYVIDLRTGITNYRQNFGKNENVGTRGYKDLVSVTYSTDNTHVAALFNSQTHKLFNCGSMPKSSKYTGSMSIPYVINETCYFSFNSYYFETKKNLSVLFRVDLEGDIPVTKWKIEIPGMGLIGKRGYWVLGDRLYVMDRDLYCINTDDGSILWQQPNIYGGLGGLIIADNKLIVGSSHINSFLYAFDLMTGEILWKEPFSNSASPLQYHNCVIYSVSWTLQAFDVSTGKQLYEMTCPFKSDDSDSYFVTCTVDPPTNSIILTNYKYVMKYQLPGY